MPEEFEDFEDFLILDDEEEGTNSENVRKKDTFRLPKFGISRSSLEKTNDEKLLEILKKPYNNQSDILDYQIPSSSNEKYQTFCGT